MKLFHCFLACWKLFGLFVAPSEAIWLFSCLLVVSGILLVSFVAPGEAILLPSCLLEFIWDRLLLVFNG